MVDTAQFHTRQRLRISTSLKARTHWKISLTSPVWCALRLSYTAGVGLETGQSQKHCGKWIHVSLRRSTEPQRTQSEALSMFETSDSTQSCCDWSGKHFFLTVETCIHGLLTLDRPKRWILQTGRGVKDSIGSWLVVVNWWWFIWIWFTEKKIHSSETKLWLPLESRKFLNDSTQRQMFIIISWLLLKMNARSHAEMLISVMSLKLHCFQIIHIAHIAPIGLPSLPPRDLLNPITVAITSLFPADVPHLPPFPTLLMSSRTATGWRLLKLCTHCDLTHWDGKKPIFCSAGALLSSHSFPNYQLCLSSSHLHFAATFRRRCSVALFFAN